MDNRDIHIGIVGAGRIGTAIYNLLIASDRGCHITIADIVSKPDWSINRDHYEQLQIKKPLYSGENVQFNEFVKDKTLIINALPFHENIHLYQACLESNIPYFDLSEDDALDEWIEKREYVSETRTGLPFTMPHCGLAPGLSTVVANYISKDFHDLHSVKIRVGALSKNATNKLKYHTSWSGDGLVNEYMGKCQVIRDGMYCFNSALSGYETLTINGQEFEAFNTSGGIGTFAKTLCERGTITGLDVDYKTLRRVGHHQYVDFLFKDLKLPSDILNTIFKKYVPTTDNDEVIIYVTANGIAPMSYEYFERTYHRVFGQQVYRGRTYTAIEFTTAAGMISMVELYLDGKLPKEGYVTQESVNWDDVITTTYGKFYREENDEYSLY